MAAGKEIRGKIKSVENTKKITKAMEMVAASKMRKAQERMRAARPYSEKIRNIAANLGHANPEYVHPFMKVNDAKTAGVIVVTTDKGLCGGMNTNVLRIVTAKLRELQGAFWRHLAARPGNEPDEERTRDQEPTEQIAADEPRPCRPQEPRSAALGFDMCVATPHPRPLYRRRR